MPDGWQPYPYFLSTNKPPFLYQEIMTPTADQKVGNRNLMTAAQIFAKAPRPRTSVHS